MSDRGSGRLRPTTIDPQHPLFGLGYAQPVERCIVERLSDEGLIEADATVAQETPVTLVYNGRPHVVMMGTPADVEDFALGFTLTQEIVPDSAAVRSINVRRYSQGIEVEIAIPESAAQALQGRGRSLEDALRWGQSVEGRCKIAPAAIYRAGQELPSWRRYNEEASALHAAGWATREGHIVQAREDVGRQNALDKLIGAMVRASLDPREGFTIVTSRASYELVQKCAVAGIAVLAALSRPTRLAVEVAEAAGITLVGLVREHSANVYSHAERLEGDLPALRGERSIE